MLDDTTRLNGFGKIAREAWLRRVEADLKGQDFERRLVKPVAQGIAVQPLYTREDVAQRSLGWPGQAPFVRGADALGHAVTGWDIRPVQRTAHLEEARTALQQDLHGGAHSVWIVFDESVRRGEGPLVGDGVIACSMGALDVLLRDVDLRRVPIALYAGALALPAAAGLLALARRRSVPLAELRGWLYTDPLGSLAHYGRLPTGLDTALDDMAELAHYCQRKAPKVRAAVVSTAAYHEGGADAVDELALALATGITYLRTLLDAGLPVDSAAQQIGFDFSVGRDFFLEIAKLRAARTLWSRVVSVAGGQREAQAMRIHARCSARTKTARDPWVNLLRGTAESFAAAVAGADSITTSPFDTRLGEPDALARRLARNTQVILSEESSLHRVIDPAGGSFYLEELTRSLAEAAWQQMQSYEAQGGVAHALLEGQISARLAASAKQDDAEVAKCALSITGVNEFPDFDEAPVVRQAPDLARAQLAEQAAAGEPDPDLPSKLRAISGNRERVEACMEAAACGASFAQLRTALGDERELHARAPAVAKAPFAAAFEALRTRSDAALSAQGRRPLIFLANLGSVPEHKARAAFATNLFQAGGLSVLANLGFETAEQAGRAFAESQALLACVCGSDETYAAQAESVARALAAHGARAVVLAGKPANRANLTAAGFTDFIYKGSDALSTLASLLDRAEVPA